MSSSTATSTLSDPAGAHTGEVRKLSTLVEVSQALSNTLDLPRGLQQVLEILARHHGAIRGTVLLLNSSTGQMELQAAVGDVRPGPPPQMRVGEGVAGRAVESGEPIVVPRIGHEPRFLHRMADRSAAEADQLSYVAAPILLQGQPVGVLGIDLRFKADRDYHRTAKFLGVVASIIGQSLKVQQLIEVERRRLADENQTLRAELQERYDFSNIIGTSGSMRSVQAQVAQVARTNTTVLLRGESGTGKELLAHAIHYSSVRAEKPFVKVNCAALPHDLIESELFGYERGAFTGAQTSRQGRFEAANGGTLFLDEVGELSLATQVKLLRVLQEREFERLGSTRSIRVDIRLIAATNKDLEKAIEAGEFREDLFYRLNVFALFVPPLRERKSDILLLADHLLEKFAREHSKPITRISTSAIDMLVSYHWPGNVRELANAIERAVVVCDGNVIHGHHLPPTLQTAEATGTLPSMSLEALLNRVEVDAIQDALKSARGNRAKAARLLHTTERIFNYKVRKHEIDWRRFRP